MTVENYWEQRVRSALAPALENGGLTIVEKTDALFENLNAAFPVLGTRIDWGKVPRAIHQFSKGAMRDDFEQFFRANASRVGLHTHAYYLSDSALDFAIHGDVTSLDQWLPVILENPQHHYFAAEDFSWCMALTMEGDMTFGLRP